MEGKRRVTLEKVMEVRCQGWGGGGGGGEGRGEGCTL